MRQPETIASDYASKLNSIRGAGQLSDRGKASHMARLYLEARTEMTESRSALESARRDRRRSLERRLFGISSAGNSDSASISYRDAQDRAERLETPGAAAALLARAESSGDDTLARAIAAHAFAKTWTDVLDTYCSSRPQLVEDQINELYRIQDNGSTRQAIVREIEGPRISRPVELPEDDDSIAALAAEGLELSTAS